MPKTIDHILSWDSPVGPLPKPEILPVKIHPTLIDHKPIFSEEAEMGTLGSILLDPEKVFGFCLKKQVLVGCFYLRHHQLIYASMLRMNESGRPIDTLTLADRLKTQGKLEEIGGIAYLNRLLDSTPTAAHAEYYVDLVLEYNLKRRLEEIKHTPTNGKTALESIDEIQVSLDSIRPAVAFPPVSAAVWALEILPEPDEILTGAFDTGTKCIIVAPSKARKSFFLLQAAVSIAAGMPQFIAWDIPKPRRVLFWNLEITPAHFHKRLLRMLRALDLTPADLGDRLFIVNSRGTDPDLQQLAGLIKSTGSEIAFIDPIYKLIPGDENKQEEIKHLLRGLDRLCTESGAAIVYSHHCGKGMAGDRLAIDRASGTGVLARDFDCQIGLVPHVDEGLLVCEQIARSYPPRDAFCIKWDNDRCCFNVEEGTEPVIQTTQNRNRSGRAGPPLTDDDALNLLMEKPLQGAVFAGELKRLGFTQRAGREVKARLLESGQIAMMKTKEFPSKIYIGTPGGIEQLKLEHQNQKLPNV